jgi:hypothetical protein
MAEQLSKYYVGALLQSDQEKETRDSDNKNDPQSHSNTTIYAKTRAQP